ncbi:MAG: hypothetical protein COA63_003480 [Methylophaga sp.]|nr:hypothetical protein [Methylophaga sp.]
MSDTILPPTKTARVLAALMSGRSFNRFEAERELHDHCLHSTVATLGRKYGITISRQFETVPGYQGMPTSVCRYWITLEERKRFEKQKVNIRKQKTQTTSDQTNEMGFQLNKADDTAITKKPQPEPNNEG